MSNNPSLFISTITDPVDQELFPETPAVSVISVNFKLPLFKKSLLDPWFAVKKISSKSSSFISPKETPPPL